MIITIKPKNDTILKAIPTSLKPIFKNKGPIANVIVQNGTLKIGDCVVSGFDHGSGHGSLWRGACFRADRACR